MGAIAVAQDTRGRSTQDVVQAMAAAAPHRGDRIAALTHGAVGLATVNDEDLVDACVGISDGTAVAFVGSLDNASELRADLRARGASLGDGSLVELLAAAARAHGDDLPRRLRGVFAAAISDGKSVFCFRDQIGYRPLFYRRDASGFYAASE